MLEDILNPPTEEMKVKILEASNEDPGRLIHNMALLEKWMSSESYLPKSYDRNLLEGYLRACKHNIEKTKTKLEMYFIERANDGLLGYNKISMMDHDLRITSMVQSFPLPEMTEEGYRIVLRKFQIKDTSLFNVVDLIRYETMLCDLRLHYDIMSAGQVMIYDASNTGVPPLRKILTPDFWRTIAFAHQALPFRFKQLHVITNSSTAIKLVTVVKTFLPEKVASRFYVHSSAEGVFKYIPQKLFPSDYGGTKKSCQELTEEWNATLMKLEDWFRQLHRMQIVGPIPKRLEQSYSEYFGPDGSFRKLDID